MRGWLRRERRPRTTAAIMVAGCAGVAAGLVHLCVMAAWAPLGPRIPLAIIATWPLFLLALRWRASVLFAQFDPGDSFREYLLHDDAAESATHDGSNLPEWMRNAWDEGGKAAASRELGRAVGSSGCIGIVTLAALTAGSYLLWDLVQSGPTLLAQTMHDHCLYRARPSLF